MHLPQGRREGSERAGDGDGGGVGDLHAGGVLTGDKVMVTSFSFSFAKTCVLVLHPIRVQSSVSKWPLTTRFKGLLNGIKPTYCRQSLPEQYVGLLGPLNPQDDGLKRLKFRNKK